jgi:hypothetical protein
VQPIFPAEVDLILASAHPSNELELPPFLKPLKPAILDYRELTLL